MKKTLYSLGGEDASAADGLDLLLGLTRKEPRLDDDGLLGKAALAQHLEESGAGDVDDGRLFRVLLVLNPRLLADQRPQLVDVNGRTVLIRLVGVNVEVPHADLTEVARMVFVEVDSVVVLTAGVSATSGMLAVFADAAVAVGNVAAKLPRLLLVRAHI